MRNISRVLAAAMLAGISSEAPAAVPLQPTSKWNVNYDVAQCTAVRKYGSAEKPLSLVFKPSPFGGVIRVLVIKKGGFPGGARQTQASVQFDDQSPIRTNALKFSSHDRKLTVYSFNLSADDFKARQLSKSISLSSEGMSQTFTLDEIPALLEEIEKCRLDLLDRYNADGARLRQEATPVKPLSEIYSAEDYPAGAVWSRDQGTVTISLLIDEAGKVKDCTVDTSAGVAALDTMSCYVI